MSLDRDLEFGVPQQPSSDVQVESKEHIQDTSIIHNNYGKSNTPASDHSITTIFDFDESGKYERQARIEGLPSLPCLRVILRKLNASSFDDGLGLSLDEKELTSNNERKVQQDADSEAEARKIIGAFFNRVLGGRTSKFPSHPSFGIWELFRLWARDNSGFFPVVDPIFDDAKLETTLLNEPWLLERSHILYLTQYGSAFYMLPAEMRTKNLSEKHLQVECKFLSRQNISSTTTRLPLSTEFEKLLESEESATALFDGCMQIGAKLVTLDMLRASIECWSRFLISIREKSSAGDFEPDWHHLQHDIEHIKGFGRSVRDIGEATEATCIAIADFHEIASDRQHRYHMIAYETRWKLSAMKNVMEDLQSHFDNLMHLQESARSITREASLKRLTLFASVFLPISLASSLLSMSTRAATLGALWYDFFGICIVLGFIMYVVYQTFRNVAKLWEDEDTVRTLRQVWNFFWRLILLNDQESLEKKQMHRQQMVAEGKMSAEQADREAQEDNEKKERRDKKQDKLRLFSRVAKSTALWTFHMSWTVATASFLVGMFKNISTGLLILGYGAAGSLACAILFILPYRFVSEIFDDRIDYETGFNFGFDFAGEPKSDKPKSDK